MALGYDKPLYLMAFDHRDSFARDLFRVTGPPSEIERASIVDAKNLIYEAFEQAIHEGAPRGEAGVLVDEEFGAAVAERARGAGHMVAMPVESSGRAEFDFAYGSDFGDHIERFDPAFAKVLVRYNPEGDAALNARQNARLALLSKWLQDRDRKLLFELLVPATRDQMRRCGGDQARFDREIRPGLVVECLRALQAAGVEPDVWKVEGLDTAEAGAEVVARARSGGRSGVSCIVLGRGADEARVIDWLQVAAGVPGFEGLAVGRTLWEDPLRELLAGQAKRDDVVHMIADRFLETLDAFGAARAAARRRWPKGAPNQQEAVKPPETGAGTGAVRVVRAER